MPLSAVVEPSSAVGGPLVQVFHRMDELMRSREGLGELEVLRRECEGGERGLCGSVYTCSAPPGVRGRRGHSLVALLCCRPGGASRARCRAVLRSIGHAGHECLSWCT